MIDDCQFEEGRPRTLAVADATGRSVQATAELKSAVRYPTHEARHYEMTGMPEGRETGIPEDRETRPTVPGPTVCIQLNGPSTGEGRADDESRLAAIAGELLEPSEPRTPCLPAVGRQANLELQ
jgi:hypothetical protein